MPDATLYTVQMVRGTVYAVHVTSTGLLWTERSEQAARQSALERRVSIISEAVVSHEQLLRLMGHEPPVHKPAEPSPTQPVDVASIEPPKEEPQPPASAPLSSLNIPLRYHWDDEDIAPAASPDDDTIILPRPPSKAPGSVFCSERQVSESIQPADDTDKSAKPGNS